MQVAIQVPLKLNNLNEHVICSWTSVSFNEIILLKKQSEIKKKKTYIRITDGKGNEMHS